MGIMENVDSRELNPPPHYEPLKEGMRFQNTPKQQVHSTVVTMMPEGPPVRDHFLWSIFNFVYLNFCCLGFLALVFSVKSRDRKQLGDRSGSASYASTARSLNIAATVLSVLFMIIFIIIFAIQMQQLALLMKEKVKERDDPFVNFRGK